MIWRMFWILVQPVDNDEKTLFAACGIKERGACFYHRCGHALTALDIQT